MGEYNFLYAMGGAIVIIVLNMFVNIGAGVFWVLKLFTNLYFLIGICVVLTGPVFAQAIYQKYKKAKP